MLFKQGSTCTHKHVGVGCISPTVFKPAAAGRRQEMQQCTSERLRRQQANSCNNMDLSNAGFDILKTLAVQLLYSFIQSIFSPQGFTLCSLVRSR